MSTLLVAEDGSGLIRYAFLFPTHEIGRGNPDFLLQDLYVTKKKRSLGIGNKMMAAIARAAKQEDANAVYWLVNKKISAARSSIRVNAQLSETLNYEISKEKR